MINMPYDDIIKRIKEEKNISDEELKSRISKKMDQLSGLISKEGAAYIIANDLGIKLIQTNGLIKINKLVSGQRNIETAGIVTRIFDLIEFEKEDRKGKVRSFILADETGQTRITAWHDQTNLLTRIKEGDTIKITNGFVKNNQGVNEVHLNERSKVITDPEGIEIKDVKVFAARQEFARKKINELKENDQNIEVFGTIVQVFDPRFFEQCPECRKKPSLAEGNFICEQHGKITPIYGYVTNIVLDDGTDSIRAVMFKEQMQQLFGKSDEELMAFRSQIEKFETLKTDLLGEQVIVAGRVVKNDMFDRLEIRASRVITDIDPDKEIEKLEIEKKASAEQSRGAVQPKKEAEPTKLDGPKSDTTKEEPMSQTDKTSEPNPKMEKEEPVPQALKTEPQIEKPAPPKAEITEPKPPSRSGERTAEKEKAIDTTEELIDVDRSMEDDEETIEELETDKKEKLPSIDDL